MTKNNIQYLVITYNGKDLKNIYIYMTHFAVYLKHCIYTFFKVCSSLLSKIYYKNRKSNQNNQSWSSRNLCNSLIQKLIIE